MKAQDYIDKYLPMVKEAKDEVELKSLVTRAFFEFNDEVVAIAKARNTTKDKCVISIIKEVGQKWNKFCRLLNAQQDVVTFNENLFMDHWKKTLNF